MIDGILIIIIFLVVYLRKESFQTLDKKQLKSIEKSVHHFKKELNLTDTDIDLDSKLLNDYLNNYINEPEDVNVPLGDELPMIDNNNYTKYNHKLKLLLNSKKIKQLFFINMLKNKINYLTGSFKNIKELKEDMKKKQEKNKCQNL